MAPSQPHSSCVLLVVLRRPAALRHAATRPSLRSSTQQYRSVLRPSSVAPPGFGNRAEVRYGSIGGLEYEVPLSRLYCLCINVALCSTALQCICRVIRRSFMTMKAHTYYIIFGRPPIGGKLPPLGGATDSFLYPPSQSVHVVCHYRKLTLQ